MLSKSRFLYTSPTSGQNRKIPRPERGVLHTPLWRPVAAGMGDGCQARPAAPSTLLPTLAPKQLGVHFPKGKSAHNFRNRPLPPIARQPGISARFLPYVLSSKGPKSSQKGSDPNPCTRVSHGNRPPKQLRAISAPVQTQHDGNHVSAIARNVTTGSTPATCQCEVCRSAHQRHLQPTVAAPLGPVAKMRLSVSDISRRVPSTKGDSRGIHPVRPPGTRREGFRCGTPPATAVPR